MAATTPKDKARTGRGCYARPIPSLLWPSPSICAAEATFTQARATSTIELAGAPDASHRKRVAPTVQSWHSTVMLSGPLSWLPGRPKARACPPGARNTPTRDLRSYALWGPFSGLPVFAGRTVQALRDHFLSVRAARQDHMTGPLVRLGGNRWLGPRTGTWVAHRGTGSAYLGLAPRSSPP